jgi:hypothetical protein
LGLGEEATDEELVEDQEGAAEVVLLIEGREWDELRDVPGGRARVLEGVERGPRSRGGSRGPSAAKRLSAGTKQDRACMDR